jgi:uncharacterized protein
MKRFFRIFFGTVFLILGVIGLFLPVLQGILFIIVGFLILAPESKRIRHILELLRQKYPALFEKAEHMKGKCSFNKKTEDPPEKQTDCQAS